MSKLEDGETATAEVEIDTINPERETLLLTQGTHTAMNVRVDDIDPDSELGEKLGRLSEYDYVTATFEFERPQPDIIGWWRIKEIHDLRRAEGAERNAFTNE